MSLSRQSPCSRRKNQRRRRQGWPCAPLGPPEATSLAPAGAQNLPARLGLEGKRATLEESLVSRRLRRLRRRYLRASAPAARILYCSPLLRKICLRRLGRHSGGAFRVVISQKTRKAPRRLFAMARGKCREREGDDASFSARSSTSSCSIVMKSFRARSSSTGTPATEHVSRRLLRATTS